MYNVLVFGNMAAADLSGFESFMVTNLLRAVTKYCSFGSSRLVPFTRQFKDVSWFHASLPLNWAEVQKASKLKEEPAYLVTNRTLASVSTIKNPCNSLQELFSLFDMVTLQNLVSFYRLVTLILLHKLHTN